ncbi:MAG: Gfo/Idh/MocA family protein [Phycisphaerales bacterium]
MSTDASTVLSPLRAGMIGGGRGAFIGAVHRTALALDGEAVLVAGALSSDPQRARDSAADLGLAADRSYPDWRAMLEVETARPAGDRIDFVSIVTPNHAHYEPARAFAAAGIHVVLDKPMVPTREEAAELVRTVDASGSVFAVTYNYSGYPMVRQARAMVAGGAIGDVRKVFVEYHQGWLAGDLESTGQKQASWRTDPARSGVAGCVGDIGTHAAHVSEFVTGRAIHRVSADVHTFVPGRRLDDDAAVLLRLQGGIRGVLTCSQVCIGHENGLELRVHGTEGSLRWRQEHPNHLHLADASGTWRTLTRGGADVHPHAVAGTRLPSGHPEGFHEAFANIYRGAFGRMRAAAAGTAPSEIDQLVPDVRDGARGVSFVHAVIESGAAEGQWTAV